MGRPSSKNADGYTPTQVRIMDLLSDGKPHTAKEMHKLLDDDLADISGVRVHICELRKVLHKQGMSIRTEVHINGECRVASYCLVRRLHSPNDGK
jgi:hypothetical protein